MIKPKTDLFQHQKDAVNKLIRLKVGALYMEMGTGKTRTALEIAARRMAGGKINHVLWLCPCSVKVNLARDIVKHAYCEIGDITICGIKTLSSSRREVARLLDIALNNECFLIVDESNLVKNPYAIRSKNIERIAELCKYRMILNGTPVSRTEADLFQQWAILDKRILGYQSYYSFQANHIEWDEKFTGRIRRVLNVDYLTDKIAPYSFQVRKADCLSLPTKRYSTFYFGLTPEQDAHYQNVLEDFLSYELIETEDAQSSILIYRALNALQQVTSGRKIKSSASLKEKMSHVPFFLNPEDNPRICALLDVLKAFGNEKVVVWCKFTHEIHDVESVLTKRGYTCVNFYGDLPLSKRQKSLDSFGESEQILIANKSCAGYGLNLQFAHNAVYYDNDWDWATRAQSEDRLHRIGQTEPVTLVDLCANQKIDERILRCLQRKENMVESFKHHLKAKNLLEWLSGKAETDD